MKTTSKFILALAERIPRGFAPLLRLAARHDPFLRDFQVELSQFPEVSFRIDLRESVCIPVWKYGCYPHQRADTHLLVELVEPDDVVYDVGANIGYLTKIIHLSLSEEGRLHAFEPSPRALRLLYRNVSVSAHMVVVEAAVGADSGSVTFIEKNHLDLSSVEIHEATDSGHELMKVPLITLDSYARGQQLPDVVKIDVEGHEPDVLKGMSRILDERAPVIFFESLHESHYRDCVDIITDAGEGRGYRFGRVSRNVSASTGPRHVDHDPQPGFVAPSVDDSTTNNYVAIPEREIQRTEGLRGVFSG